MIGSDGDDAPAPGPSPRELTTVPDSVLEELARVDIAYEVQQYTTWAGATRVGVALGGPAMADLLGKALLEVRVLHLRNLAEFLRKGRPAKGNEADAHRQTDVVADHYFVDGWPNKPLGYYYDATSGTRNRWVGKNIDRHLAHITRSRVDRRKDGKAFTWSQVSPMLVIDGFEEFLNALELEDPVRASWFDECRHHIATMRALGAKDRSPNFLPEDDE